jgi:hypothetical protein
MLQGFGKNQEEYLWFIFTPSVEVEAVEEEPQVLQEQIEMVEVEELVVIHQDF